MERDGLVSTEERSTEQTDVPELTTRDKIVAGLVVLALTAFLVGPWTWQKLIVLVGLIYVGSWLKAKALERIPLVGGA